ncbi:hypothetical protein C5B42_06035 [Candidatus Cerribacteria bacterium 'Amazon FNV 2010 28 9']|uniref:Uncharacterized protein n=1 Tax=Candidatus Cerribacteria bacterium 'Amazon FNV 2010 28 9' TaxID=2081795 RepID=A0A317JQW0_9BACT|nr:MAG: hypothetical protein C5B42_06035 [Candidatus Cerribacteria bacterium 'Amazon FNV 2010 28 9']
MAAKDTLRSIGYIAGSVTLAGACGLSGYLASEVRHSNEKIDEQSTRIALLSVGNTATDTLVPSLTPSVDASQTQDAQGTAIQQELNKVATLAEATTEAVASKTPSVSQTPEPTLTYTLTLSPTGRPTLVLTNTPEPSLTPVPATNTATLTPTPDANQTGTAVYEDMSTQAVDPSQGLNPKTDKNPRLADANQLKQPGVSDQSWMNILYTLDGDPTTSDNVFAVSLRTIPTSPDQLGRPGQTGIENMRLGHDKASNVQYYTVSTILENPDAPAGVLLTTSADGKRIMGGVIGDLRAASFWSAFGEVVSQDTTGKTAKRRISDLLLDDTFVAKVMNAQSALLGRDIQKFTGTDVLPFEYDLSHFGADQQVVLKKAFAGQNAFQTCEQKVSVYSGKGSRGENGVIVAPLTTHAKDEPKLLTSADTAQEVFFVPFTTMMKDKYGQAITPVSGAAIATDRDFAWESTIANGDVAAFIAIIEQNWASEDFLIPCASTATGLKVVKTPENTLTVVPSFQPDTTPFTPVGPTKTPQKDTPTPPKVTNTATPVETTPPPSVTPVKPNPATSAPTATQGVGKQTLVPATSAPAITQVAATEVPPPQVSSPTSAR